MTTLTIHDLPDPVRQALCARADRNGRSLDAEVREILEEAADAGNAQPQASATPSGPAEEKGLGTVLYEAGRRMQLTDEEVALINSVRDKTPMRIFSFDDPA